MEKFEKLEQLRLKKGLNYQDMADKLGISKCFYWQIEHRTRRLTYLMAKRIAKVLGTKPDAIFYEEIDIEKIHN